MSALLSIPNFSGSNLLEKSFLDVASVAGAGSLTLRSAQSFQVDKFVLIGQRPSETVELRRVLTVTAPATLTIPALDREHGQFTPVQVLANDKFKVYRATNVNGTPPADASFAFSATVDIDPDDLQTLYEDATGGAGFWYKFTHFNSITLAETALSTSVAVRGSSDARYCTLDDVRKEAGFSGNENIPDSEVERHRKAAEDEVNASLRSRYTLPFPEVPALIERIACLLAAGNLLSNEYERFEDYQTDRGSGKRKEARMMLKDIKNGDKDLFDSDSPGDTAGDDVRGLPNSESPEREFTIGMRF